ncbi:MAG TPA: hypothetical protein PLB32_22930, partial [Acidobacteriota bacterium]|nr:hypothetical protein [Acidobacteriota bacterium]
MTIFLFLYGSLLYFWVWPAQEEQKKQGAAIAKIEKENEASRKLFNNYDELVRQTNDARNKVVKLEQRLPTAEIITRLESEIDRAANSHGLTIQKTSNNWANSPKPGTGININTLNLTVSGNGNSVGSRQLSFLTWISLYPQFLTIKTGRILFDPATTTCSMELELLIP